MRKFLACCAVLASVSVVPASVTPAAAQPQVAGQLGQCLAIFGAIERLSCYDRVARAMNPGVTSQVVPPQQPTYAPAPYAAAPAVAAVPAARAAAPAPYVPPPAAYAAAPPPAPYVPPAAAYAAAAPVAVAPGAQTNAQQFGSEYLAAAAPAKGTKTMNTIESMVQSFRFTTGHRFVVLLENGQEWKQIEGDTARPNLTSLKTRSVTISRGLLGSYNLVFSDQTGAYKVERTL